MQGAEYSGFYVVGSGGGAIKYHNSYYIGF